MVDCGSPDAVILQLMQTPASILTSIRHSESITAPLEQSSTRPAGFGSCKKLFVFDVSDFAFSS
jgi:hypothetical protein